MMVEGNAVRIGKVETVEASGISRLPARGRKHGWGPEVDAVLVSVGVESIADAARKLGLREGGIWARLSRGWTPRQAFGLDPAPEPQRRVFANHFGPEVAAALAEAEAHSLAELAEHHGVSHAVLVQRLRRGVPIREAVGGSLRAISTNTRAFSDLKAACAATGIAYSAVYKHRREHGCTTQEAFDAVFSARRARRLAKTKAHNATEAPLPEAVVFGWRFKSWTQAHEYWQGKYRPALDIVLRSARAGSPGDHIFHAVYLMLRDVYGVIDPKTRLRNDRPLPPGVEKVGEPVIKV